MRGIIRGAFGLTVALAIVASGCSEQDNPVGLAPHGAGLFDIIATADDGSIASASDSSTVAGSPVAVDESVRVVARDRPLASPITVTQTIGAEGGKIEIREAGLKLHIPSGALTTATTITVTALAGNGVAYDFQPHGLVFNKPLVAVQAFKVIGTTIPSVQGGYFPDNAQLDMANLVGRIREREATEVRLSERKIRFNVPHFSGYLLSID